MYHRKKSIISKIIGHPAATTALGLFVLILISMPLVRNIKKQISINEEIDTLETEISELEGKNSELKGLISYLNSDEFAEEQARLNLNYKKPGEEVMVIKDQNAPEVSEAANGQAMDSIYSIEGLKNRSQKESSNPKKWLDYFLKNQNGK